VNTGISKGQIQVTNATGLLISLFIRPSFEAIVSIFISLTSDENFSSKRKYFFIVEKYFFQVREISPSSIKKFSVSVRQIQATKATSTSGCIY
jgi:uncharacterized protein (UPF0262 family)